MPTGVRNPGSRVDRRILSWVWWWARIVIVILTVSCPYLTSHRLVAMLLCVFTGCLDIEIDAPIDGADGGPADDSGGLNQDSGIPATPEAFDWATPIAAEHLGHEPHPLLKGVRIHEIVNSWKSAREDDLMCSDCHHEVTVYPYRPDVELSGPSSFGPDDVVDGRVWSEPGGWAERFIDMDESTASPKPPYLRELFRLWLQTQEGR